MHWAWARFENHNGDIFRINTRVYLQPIEKPSCKEDKCIGAFIGKNPGSAQQTSPNVSELQPIKLGKDKFLPTVRNIMIKAYRVAEKEIIPHSYIQILNLFYLCDPILDQAMIKIRRFLPNPPIDCSENNEFPFVFYSWGGENEELNEYKNRLINNIRANNHIWFDKNETKLIKPNQNNFVKHIQGLPYGNILKQIADVI